jgi:transcriptional regulator NrdR family protein
MNCPMCESTNLKVTDSRPKEGTIKRRRICLECEWAWHTYELSLTEEEFKVYLSRQDKKGYSNFTEEEDRLIQEYLSEGFTHAKIARLINRSKYSVRGRVRKLGLTGSWIIKDIV